MCASIARDLAELYPGHIETRQDWFFNIAGGATGIMILLQGSLSEYLILFGMPAHRERRDHIMRQDKYGADWSRYCAKVRRRIVPGLY